VVAPQRYVACAREKWPHVISATVDMMIRFEAVIRPHLGGAVRAVDTGK